MKIRVSVFIALCLICIGCQDHTEKPQVQEQPSEITDKQEPVNSGNRVCFIEHCFEVELALTKEEHAKGLMYRRELEPDRGMLFIFQEEDYYNFWMMNTYVTLDIIWIDSEKKIVYISRDSKPCTDSLCPTISPGKKAQYVLEITSGAADQVGLQIGDKLTFELNEPADQ